MSRVAALIQDMIAAGVSAELIGRTAALLAEREAVVVPDEQAERRREKDRIRKRLRNSADSAEFQNSAPQIKETSPRPPKENYPLSSEPSVLRCGSARRHDWPEDFCEQLWAIYPRKTEKKAGIDALTRLHRSDRLAWPDLIGGVEALADSDPQFVPALGRWLRGERWKDERPAARPPPFREAKRNSLLDGLDEIERRFAPNVQQFPRIAG
jgi:hypothetical protein